MKQPRRKPVMVTEAYLPPKEEFLNCVESIYESHMLSNQGPYVETLEKELARFLGAPQLTACANGTLGLQLALRLFNLNGKKVITTPFTYVATLSSLLWENCTPVFADIDPLTLCLDPASVAKTLEKHPDTAAIMPVHVFGFACDVEAFSRLAAEHDLKIIYDAAHAFGSILNGRSLLTYGDASVCSFHATKLFHTVEGGCIVTQSSDHGTTLTLLRAFGHRGDTHFLPGINAKLSELHGAMGLTILRHIPELLEKRSILAQAYDSLLMPGITPGLSQPKASPGLEWNHAYYPVIFSSVIQLEKVMAALAEKDIHPRRYFYPSLTALPYAPDQTCPIADDIASRIICLPFWADMPLEIAEEVSQLILETINRN